MSFDTSDWPEDQELEACLMKIASDTDPGAMFLRKVLGMNPAYGVYMRTDKDLAQIVQLFAKRLRSKVTTIDGPLTVSMLYEPLCEIIWRVIGHVLYTILELQDAENLPVPKEAVGQIRMLLETNVKLSRKLNEMRRAYLRELTEYRDRERKLSEKTQRVVASLQEQPVMFYEPLHSVLDETTKEFVKGVIEERVKLEMVDAAPKTENELVARHMEEKEKEISKLRQEMRQLRAKALRGENDAQKLQDKIDKLNSELTKQKELAEERLTQYEEVKIEVEGLRGELKRIQSEGLGQAAEKMQQMVSDLEEKVKTLEEENKRKAEQIEKLMKDRGPKIEATGPVEVKVEMDAALEADLRQQIKDGQKVEEHLRNALREAEKALDEARASAGPGKSDDEDKAKATKKLNKQWEDKVKDMKDEIEELKKQLAKMTKDLAKAERELEDSRQAAAGGDDALKALKKRLKEAEARAEELEAKQGESSKAKDWRIKFEELEEKYDLKCDECEQMKHQIRELLAKLRDLGGQEAVAETLMKIRMTAPMPKRKKKLKAYERLYQDAQRRIVDMRMKQEAMKRLEEESLKAMANSVKDQAAARQAELLKHLQKASQATQSRFHDALSRFHDRQKEQADGKRKKKKKKVRAEGEEGTTTEEEEGDEEEEDDEEDDEAIEEDEGVGEAEDMVTMFEKIMGENEELQNEVTKLKQQIEDLLQGKGDAEGALQALQAQGFVPQQEVDVVQQMPQSRGSIDPRLSMMKRASQSQDTRASFGVPAFPAPAADPRSEPVVRPGDGRQRYWTSAPGQGDLEGGQGGLLGAAPGGLSLGGRQSVVPGFQGQGRSPSPPQRPGQVPAPNNFNALASSTWGQGFSVGPGPTGPGRGPGGDRATGSRKTIAIGTGPAPGAGGLRSQAAAETSPPGGFGGPYGGPGAGAIAFGVTGVGGVADVPPWRRTPTPGTPGGAGGPAPPGQAARPGMGVAPGVPGRVPPAPGGLQPLGVGARQGNSASPPPQRRSRIEAREQPSSRERATSSPRGQDSTMQMSRSLPFLGPDGGGGGAPQMGRVEIAGPRVLMPADTGTTFPVAGAGARAGAKRATKAGSIFYPPEQVPPEGRGGGGFMVTAIRSQAALTK